MSQLEQYKDFLLNCSKNNISIIVKWKVTDLQQPVILVKQWNMFYSRPFSTEHSFLLGIVLSNMSHNQQKIIPITEIQLISQKDLTEYDKKRAFDTYSQSTFHEIIQKTIQLYNQFHLYSLLNNSSSPVSTPSSPQPLIPVDNEIPDYPPLLSSEPSLSSSTLSTQPNVSSLKRPESLQSKESIDEESIPSKKPKEVAKYNYMGVKHKLPTRRIREDDSTTNGFLIFDNPNKTEICPYCKLPLSTNPQVQIQCSKCHKSFHYHCSWGNFYHSNDPSIQWLCHKCIVHHIIQVYHPIYHTWEWGYVLSYNTTTNQHEIQFLYESTSLSLGHFVIRYYKQDSVPPEALQCLPLHDVVIEKRDSLICYKQHDYFTDYKTHGYHCLPQVLSFTCQSTLPESGIAMIIQRRMSINHQIEILVVPHNTSCLHAKWIPQNILTESGKKELHECLIRQLLFSPLWSHILNIAEEAYYYQEYSPILSGNLKLNSTNDILKECCCICRKEGKNNDMIYCDGCNLLYHLDCLTPKLKEIPESNWYCDMCKSLPQDNDRSMYDSELTCWFANSFSRESSYSIYMLPAGPEILSRQNREDDETEKYIAMSLKDYEPTPLPTLQTLENYPYKGDELHKERKRLSTFTNQKLVKIMNDLNEYRLTHLFTSQNTDYFSLCSCLLHHFYSTHRLLGPIVIVTPDIHIDNWLDSLHTYTFLKVTVLSESTSERKEQWIRSIGTVTNILFGEYQVFLLPLTIYKQKVSLDVSYLNKMGVTFLLFDSIFLNKKQTVLDSFPPLKEFNQTINRVNDIGPVFVLFIYCMKSPVYEIPPSFINQSLPLLSAIENNETPIHVDFPGLKQQYQQFINQSTSTALPRTFITYFYEEETHADSNILESIIFAPISSIQAKCLDSLYLRFIQLLNKQSSIHSFYLDIIISIFLEMSRIYLHPMFAGCSEQALLSSSTDSSWSDSFIQASGKMMVLHYCLQAYQQKKSTFIFTVYSRSIRFCHYLYKYYTLQGYTVYCLFGVHTYQEFSSILQQLKKNRKKIILILGPVPAGLTLPCPFVKKVYIHETELYHSLDLAYLKNVFQIGNFGQVHIINLVLASSFEIEYFLPVSKMFEQYQKIFENEESSFVNYLKMYLVSHHSDCYGNYEKSSLNYINVDALKFIRLGDDHHLEEKAINYLKNIIPSCNDLITLPKNLPSLPPELPVQSLFEHLWLNCNDIIDIMCDYDYLESMIPPPILTGNGLENMNLEMLEICSQLDFLICHFLQRLGDHTNNLVFEGDISLRRRKKGKDKQMYSIGIPLYNELCIYLRRIRLAMRFNNYWVVVPYQDIFRKCS